MNIIHSLSVIILTLLLVGCDESERGTPVGTELPNGYVVNESKRTDDMPSCIAYAIKIRDGLDVASVHETNNETVYTAVVNLHTGNDLLQICTLKSKNFTNYASARRR